MSIDLFSKETLLFLVENKLQNSRDWYNGHKEQYKRYVEAPLISMAERLAPALAEIDDRLICSPKVGGSVSRIWRDTRYAKDKSIFRDAMWCMFVREKNLGLPEFFFVVMPGEFLYGCGYYSAGAASMERIRNMIVSGDQDFKNALAAYESQDIFAIDGDKYKRGRYPDAPENLREWLERKSLAFIRSSKDFELLFSDSLCDAVADGYKLLAPIYRFLMKAEEAQP